VWLYPSIALQLAFVVLVAVLAVGAWGERPAQALAATGSVILGVGLLVADYGLQLSGRTGRMRVVRWVFLAGGGRRRTAADGGVRPRTVVTTVSRCVSSRSPLRCPTRFWTT
jgi:hypothetical protein